MKTNSKTKRLRQEMFASIVAVGIDNPSEIRIESSIQRRRTIVAMLQLDGSSDKCVLILRRLRLSPRFHGNYLNMNQSQQIREIK
jgi:hypothetical protein